MIDWTQLNGEHITVLAFLNTSFTCCTHPFADQFAMPDLGVSAMENWGLITYQERSLLYEEGVSSVLDKQIITVLVAHELAHQVRVCLKSRL